MGDREGAEDPGSLGWGAEGGPGRNGRGQRGPGVGRAIEAAGCAERREAVALAAPGRCWVCTRAGRGRAVMTGRIPSSAEMLPRKS